MFVVTAQLVEQHITELQADAARARQAREVHPAHPGHNPVSEFVGSIVTSIRVALEPVLPVVPAFRA